jgi:hypothetical protein
MQEKDDEPKEKHPTEMTSDELLDYAIAPEVSEHVKRMAHPDEDSDSDPEEPR